MKSISRLSKGHYLNRGAVFLLVAALIAGIAACGQVTPPPPGPEEIWDWNGLNATRNNLRGNYRLMKDLDKNTSGYATFNLGPGWEPIGTLGGVFRGTFDGQGRTISGLVINRPDRDYVGLFGFVQTGTIKNVRLEAVNVTGRKHVGALVGSNYEGAVVKATAAGSVTGEDSVGGLVGYVWGGSVRQSQSSAAVSSAGPRRAGGLVGHNSLKGVISDCEYTGGKVSGQLQVGGLVGLNAGSVVGCTGTGNVTGVSVIGGVAGLSLRSGNLNGSKFTGYVNGKPYVTNPLDDGTVINRLSADVGTAGWYIGGLVGWNEGEVDGCSADSAVLGTQNAGGLVGWNDGYGTLSQQYEQEHVASLIGYRPVSGLSEDSLVGTIRNSHSTGSVTGVSYVGGLVGGNEGFVDSCFSAGKVIGAADVGGLVGWSDDSKGEVINSFWDTVSSGIAGTDSRWGTGKTTTQLKDINTYKELGWDICAVARGEINTACTWNIAPGSYPFLSGKEPIRYTLTISSTAGGSVTTPGEGTFTYDAGKVVSLVATPASGYQFVIWTASAGVFANANAATTSFTMPGQGVTVTASFERTTPGPATIIKIGVAGDMSVPHGVNMMQGAQIAIDAIGPFTAGGNTYVFQLIEMNTADLSGDIAATKLAVEAKIADVNYVIGGFRTEHTKVMQEVICEDNGKIFLGLGAGGTELTENVQADFDSYKYFFRLLPINDIFLGASAAKIVQSVILTLIQDPALPFESPADINVYLLAEQAEWATPIVVTAETMLLPALGVNHVGTARPSDRAAVGDLSATISDMAAKDTHVVMTVMAGLVGFSWAQARHQAGLPVISAGINGWVQMSAFGQLGAAALGEITLDTTARDVQLSPKTQPFLNAFFAKHNEYPLYTGVSAYDSMYLLKAAIQETGSLSSADIAAAIPGLDLPGVSGKLAFYPRAAVDLGSVQPGLRALSAAQAYALYGDHLLTFYGHGSFAEMEANWGAHSPDWTSPPHLPQDLAYGPAAGNTAIASQWQGTAAAPVKVAVWPRQHAPTGTPVATLKEMGLFDKWGNWNFQFAGTQPLYIPQLFYDTWG